LHQDAIKRATGIRMREQRLISGAQEMHEDELLTDPLYIRLSFYRKMASSAEIPKKLQKSFSDS